LRKSAKKVSVFDDELQKLASDMAETMYAAPGVGLAANQVGVLKQIITIDASRKDEPKNLLALVNPELVWSEGAEEMEEGCLSLPEFKQNVERATAIKVRAQDPKGAEIEVSAEGILARVIQHEMDHLQGKLLTDYANLVRRDLYMRKRRKLLKGR